jgi:hypothetical protein
MYRILSFHFSKMVKQSVRPSEQCINGEEKLHRASQLCAKPRLSKITTVHIFFQKNQLSNIVERNNRKGDLHHFRTEGPHQAVQPLTSTIFPISYKIPILCSE